MALGDHEGGGRVAGVDLGVAWVVGGVVFYGGGELGGAGVAGGGRGEHRGCARVQKALAGVTGLEKHAGLCHLIALYRALDEMALMPYFCLPFH